MRKNFNPKRDRNKQNSSGDCDCPPRDGFDSSAFGPPDGGGGFFGSDAGARDDFHSGFESAGAFDDDFEAAFSADGGGFESAFDMESGFDGDGMFGGGDENGGMFGGSDGGNDEPAFDGDDLRDAVDTIRERVSEARGGDTMPPRDEQGRFRAVTEEDGQNGQQIRERGRAAAGRARDRVSNIRERLRDR